MYMKELSTVNSSFLGKRKIQGYDKYIYNIFK